ncbi:MAG TPA: MFS transporter [Streptosporangiaceae bacterium]|nr:MFS transporter [Streptosporangiaceae bacterium]
MQLRSGSPLRGHRDFNKLWFGQAVSSVGSQVTLLAMPLTAVLYLHADAGQVGVLTAAGLAAYCGPSLLFGVMADRVRRRTLMIAADIGRTVVIALIPVLAWLHSLNMPLMYAVELVQGGLTVIFEVAYRAYLPDLVGTEGLLSGNSRLQGTASVAQVGGPGLSGVLVSLLGAPFALLADAGSFVVSWASLLTIRAREPAPRREHRPGESGGGGAQTGLRGVFAEMRFGLRFIWRHPVLRAVAGSAGSFNFFSQLQLTLYVIYAARVKHMSPGEIGLILVGFGIGGVVSSATAGRVLRWLGYGPSLVAGYGVAAVAIFCIPLVPGPALRATSIFLVVYFVAGYAIVGTNIAMAIMRQVASPPSLQGRVNASFRFAIGALMPVSALLAGLLGETLGLRPTLFVCGAGMPISVIWVALSPTRKVKAVEELAPDEAASDAQAAAGLGHRQA